MAGHIPDWFRTAVIYHIYPQSFQDGNGDGIGDLPGIITRLDYLADLGVTAIWLSPIYDSPFNDAGYDVRNFRAVAPRYGSLDDFRQLCRQARARDIRVLMDLVPGHTSIDHPWFIDSCKHDRNRFSDWFIWSPDMWRPPMRDGKAMKHLSGWGEREGNVATNFFSTQPKLNYGYLQPDPAYPEQLPTDAPVVRELINYMKDTMRFWLDAGASGFRIDSCGSLLLGQADPTSRHVVREFRELVDAEYPDAILIGEWKRAPATAEAAGLQASFVLHNQEPFEWLYPLPGWENHRGTPAFSDEGGDFRPFISSWQALYDELEDPGFWGCFSGNHDYRRLLSDRDPAMGTAIMTLVLTMPGTPTLYYGSEIGMVDVDGLASVEGGYRRTGCRTPMQWDATANAGFSTAPADDLYLPIHPAADRPTVSSQQDNADSLLSHTRHLIALHKAEPALHNNSPVTFFATDNPAVLMFSRGDDHHRLLVIINPSATAQRIPWTDNVGPAVFDTGIAVRSDAIWCQPRAVGVFRLS